MRDGAYMLQWTVSIGAGNSLSPVRRQAITWTSTKILSIGTLMNKFQWNFNHNATIIFTKIVCKVAILSRLQLMCWYRNLSGITRPERFFVWTHLGPNARALPWGPRNFHTKKHYYAMTYPESIIDGPVTAASLPPQSRRGCCGVCGGGIVHGRYWCSNTSHFELDFKGVGLLGSIPGIDAAVVKLDTGRTVTPLILRNCHFYVIFNKRN